MQKNTSNLLNMQTNRNKALNAAQRRHEPADKLDIADGELPQW